MKTRVGSVNPLYPSLVIIVGTMDKGKPNFTTVSHVGIFDLQTVSISVRKEHHCNLGLQEHNVFSINIPSVDMIKEVDLCGHVSARDYDKSKNFEVFYGNYRNAPMIRQCPVSSECVITHFVDMGNYNAYMAKIYNTHCDSHILTNNKVDMTKIQPILFSMQDYGYWSLDRRFADTGLPHKQFLDQFYADEFDKAQKINIKS
jgi:flavin reductase (DIM6/NTAB) family NADH-FMN oxidoreductase RutF